jgi:hypothetical protein
VKGPTLNEEQCYEAAKRLGSFTLAGFELGKEMASVSSGARQYMEKTGEPHPFGQRRTPAKPREPRAPRVTRNDEARARVDAMAAIPDRLDMVETVVEELKRRIDTLIADTERLASLIEAFTARQPILLMPARDALVPTHRRLADGGVGGRREARG